MNFDEVKAQLGMKIKKIRKLRGYTQEQLSEKIEVDPQHLSKIETGKYSPSLETIAKIAHELNVEIDILFKSQNQYLQQVIGLLKKITKILENNT